MGQPKIVQTYLVCRVINGLAYYYHTGGLGTWTNKQLDATAMAMDKAIVIADKLSAELGEDIHAWPKTAKFI